LIVDARFPYEFDGGHIRTAVNVPSVVPMRLLFEEFQDCNACVVFHCEFSENRGPAMMGHWRHHDRCVNFGESPLLSFPVLYLLEGGYKRFYRECPDMCVGGYVPMRDQRFVRNGELRRSHSMYLSGGLNERSPPPRSLSCLGALSTEFTGF
jgi:M-phase inducer tyrosine phosphatase